jgi:Carbohydrate family 9 binding domain-like
VRPLPILVTLSALAACQHSAYGPAPRRPIEGTQRDYACRYTREKPDLDGGLEDGVWATAPWSEPFLDAEGPDRDAPRHRTWFKMLWDERCLYVAALLEEPQVWATYDRRDMPVFHENDFEVLLDPDGDGMCLYELEVNAKGTIHDLYLHRPMAAGGPVLSQWNCEGLDGGVRVQGTLNQGDDTDRSWTVEMAIPWSCLKPPADAPAGPEADRDRAELPHGTVWRVNFARVQWQVEWKDGAYHKVPGTRGQTAAWTPQWSTDMHRAEHWGHVRFTR